ncbi:unnamed protein product [Rotaria sp. Silwood1]|nr:unnamed protein product [Rotaria sp. Silwood1]CAF1427481.1 unnamed protein product [Rotaria sp. Silwood1]CAF1435981.1 unnamed protein product [Rotaria sp. Silwood1]CAF3594596.1 unnamed protein product [Rotaria sp. Silwood1]CAF3598176.1 unnamed protein product [Rotaria sp. Silwood1]
MASTDSTPDFRLARAHGTVMVFSWMVFASTGVLYARYGRTVRVNKKKQIFGEDIWFQIHRFCLITTVIGTLLGFFLVLGQAKGRWVDQAEDGDRMFAHSILGAIVVGCALIQAWMALFRCHPGDRFRFVFNWIHRTTGMLALILSVPTIFLVVFVLLKYHDGFVTIMSLWSAWIVIIFIIFEVVEYLIRMKSSTVTANNAKAEIEHEMNNGHSASIIDGKQVEASDNSPFGTLKLILFILNFCFAISLVIPLVALIWLQG